MRESGPFQSKTRKRSNYMQVTILHGFSTYCSWRPKSELRRPFRALQGWKMDWQVFVAHGKPVWSVLWLVSQINTSSRVGLLKKACVSVVFNENMFKLVVPMHKHFFSRESVTEPHSRPPLFSLSHLLQPEKLQDHQFSCFVTFFFASPFHLRSHLPHLFPFSCACVSSCCFCHHPDMKYKVVIKQVSVISSLNDCNWIYFTSLLFFFFFFSLESLLSFSRRRKVDSVYWCKYTIHSKVWVW